MWAFIVCGILATILILGYGMKSENEDVFEKELEEAAYRYASDNSLLPNFNDSAVIYTEDLVKGNYINDERITKECIKSVSIYKGFSENQFKIIKSCDN